MYTTSTVSPAVGKFHPISKPEFITSYPQVPAELNVLYISCAVDKRLDEWVTADKVSEYTGLQAAQQPLLSHTSSGLA